jgi:autotransporter-associated beta strand protein
MVSGLREFIMPSLCSGYTRRRAVFAAARSLAIALAIMLLAGEAARADCTPTSANGVTATCSGTTINQAGGAPGSSAGVDGYGTGVELGVTVTVDKNASVTGNNRGIFLGSGGSVTNSGSITGIGLYGIRGPDVAVINNVGASITGGDTGIFAVASGASVFNAGTISGGNFAIAFNGGNSTLTLAPGSVINGNVFATGTDTFQLGGTGAATFDVSELGPKYQGFGDFNKVGSSVWTLTGTATYNGFVNVNAGTLLVNGSLASASLVFVTPGATLGGTGTVAATFLDNGATLAPGTPTSIGTLTVNIQLRFCDCSLYAIKVSGLGADRTLVNGDAILTGAPVTATVTGPTIAPRYTILTAANALTDTFGALSGNTPNGFSSSLSYDTNNVYLNYRFTPVLPAGLNRNQQGVAGAAITGAGNVFNAGGAIPVVFGALTPAMLTQISGETATGSQQTTFDAMNLFMGLLTDPFIGGRGDGATGGAGATPFAQESDGASAYASTGRKRSSAERDAHAMFSKAPLAQRYDPRWSVWAAGFGGSETTNGNAALGSNDSTSRVFGMAAGADYIFSPRTIAGFALAGGGTNFSVANGLGGGRSDLFQAGAFVRHTVGAAYITAAAAYGWQDITTDRIVTIAGIDRLRAQFNANAWSGRVEGGYRFVTPWMNGVGITPYAAGQFTTFDLPAYAEGVVSGANTFALAYAGKSVTAARSELGLRTDKSFAMQNAAILTLRGRFAWAHDFNTDRNVGATFQTLPGASFVVNGAAGAHDAALTTASAEMKWLNGFSLAGAFEGEFSNVTRSYAGKGVARYQW